MSSGSPEPRNSTSPRIGPVDAGEAAQQRRLAGAGFADDAEHLAGPEVEGDIGAADALAIEAADAGDREQRGGVEAVGERCAGS